EQQQQQQPQDVDLNSLFQACDTNHSGDIDYDEFSDICNELRLQPAQTDALFRDLDADSDGAIDFREFSQGFRCIAASLGQGKGESGSPRDPFPEAAQNSPSCDCGQERQTMDDASSSLSRPLILRRSFSTFSDFSGRKKNKKLKKCCSQDNIAELYQQIVATSDADLLQSYERVVRDLLGAVERQGAETERVAAILKRSQEQVAERLGEMEDEMEQRLEAHGQKIRKEERARAEHVIGDLKRHYEGEATDLKLAIKKLKQLENIARSTDSAEDVMELKRRMGEVTLENQKLKKNLLEAQTNVLVIQSELDSLKMEMTNRTLTFEQEQMTIKELAEERIGLLRQIEVLQATNRKIQDSNDGMRSVVESSFSSQRRSASNLTPLPDLSRTSLGLCQHSPRRSPQPYDSRSPRFPSPLEHEADSLALCDPMLRPRRASVCGETESLGAVSWSDSGLSTQQEDARYDADSDAGTDGEEGGARAREAAATRRRVAADVGGSFVDAGHSSDADAPELVEDPPATAKAAALSHGEWAPSAPVNRSGSNASSRRFIPAFRKRQESSQRAGAPSHSDRVYKLVLAGDAAVGKSSFLLRLCRNEFRKDTIATLGVDFQMKTLIVDGEHMTLQLWDTAGQERFRSIAKSYFRRADGVLLLYDVTCEKTFLNVRDWIDIIEDSAPKSIPVMLVGNKSDMRNMSPGADQKYVAHTFGEKLAMNYNALFCETSAKDGSNVVETVLHLARYV
uniref:RAS and EF-hand domain containing n=1 Tax=Petromyzon marinus TaxID=7757 RepID=S4R9B0_PETMA